MTDRRLRRSERLRDNTWGGPLIRGGQIATAIAAISGLVLLFVDRLPNHPAPQTLSVSLTHVHLQRPVTLGRFFAAKEQLRTYTKKLRRSGLTDRGIRDLLGMQGIEVSFLLEIDGPPGRQIQLKPTVYRTRGLIRAKIPPFVQVQRYYSAAWRDTGPDSTWAAYPLEAGGYYVELRMTEPIPHHRAALVAVAQTQNFRVGGN
jgi:hypothetical protein